MSSRRASSRLSMLAAIGLSCLTASRALAQGGPDIVINEIRIDQPSTDTDEYFELKGPPGSGLDALSYVVIGDGAAALGSGVVEAAIDLTGQIIPADGHFLAAESMFSLPGVVDFDPGSLPFENSDNVTHLLVRNFTGSVGDDLDTNDDGILDLTPWSLVLDLIALVEEPNPPAGTEYHYGPPSIGPDGTFVPGHVYRCEPDGTWVIGPFDPTGGEDTPGSPNLPCPPPTVIFDGLPNLPLGQAQLSLGGEHLTISNIGSSGKDGVSIDLGESAGGLEWAGDIGPAGDLPIGLKVWTDLYLASLPGVAGQDQKGACIFLSEMNGGQAAVGFDTTLLMPAQVRLEFMLEGKPVDIVMYSPPFPTHFIQGPMGSPAAGCSDCVVISNIGSSGLDGLTAQTSMFHVAFPMAPIVPAGKGGPVIADAVRFVLIDGKPMAPIGRAEILAAIPVGAAYSMMIGREALGQFGNAHMGLGMAHQTTDKNGHLIVSNIGSSGKDGVSIDLGESSMPPPQGMEFDILTPKPVIPNSSIQFGGRETSGSPIFSLDLNNITNGVFHLELLPDFDAIGSPTHTVQLFLGGRLVFSQSGMTGPVNAQDTTTAHIQTLTGMPAECGVALVSPMAVMIPGGPTIVADEILFMAELPADGGSAIPELSGVTVLCNEVPTLIILDERDINTCPADLTGDGVVNAADLAQLLGAWGACPACVEDLTGDNVVNAADLATLLGAWGACP